MERRSVRILSLVTFAMVLATDLLYIGLINAQGPGGDPTIYVPRFVAGYLAVMAALVAIALLPRQEIAAIRIPLRAAAAAGLLALGLLAAFSIGTPIVIAGILVAIALARTSRVPGSRLARLTGLFAGLVAVAVLIAGFEVTQRIIVCPPTGEMGGAGSHFVTGPYQYECMNGQLTYHSG